MLGVQLQKVPIAQVWQDLHFFHCRITWFNLAAGVRSRVARSLKELFHFLYRACSSLLISKFLVSFSTFFIFIAIPRYEVNIGFATIVLLLLHLLSFRTILWFGRWCKIYWHTFMFITVSVTSFPCPSHFILRLVFIVGLATRYCTTSLSSARKTWNVRRNSPPRPPTKGNTKLLASFKPRA